MKCNLGCGYRHKPDNMLVLKSHIKTCPSGAKVDYAIIWQDGELTAVNSAESEDGTKLSDYASGEIVEPVSTPAPKKTTKRAKSKKS